MKRSRRALEFSNLSFLDVISCGFGAVVLLVLISTYFEQTSEGDVSRKTVEKLLDQIMGTEKVYAGLQTQQSSMQDDILTKQMLLTGLSDLSRNATDQLVVLKGNVGVVDGQINAGNHLAVWNGLDEMGMPVSAGLYIYSLQSETSTMTRKMVYMK